MRGNPNTTRRRFFGFLAAIPVGVKTAANEALASKAVADAGTLAEFSGANVNSGVAPQAIRLWSLGDPKLIALAKANMLPEWALKEVEETALHHTRLGLDVDIAALRSVSPAAKIHINVARNVKRGIASVYEVSMFNMARSAFFGEGDQ